MTEITAQGGVPATAAPTSSRTNVHTTAAANARLRARYAAERRFKLYGIAAIAVAIGSLVLLLASIISTGYTAVQQTAILTEVFFDPEVIAPQGKRDRDAIDQADYNALIRVGLQAKFPDVTDRVGVRLLTGLISTGAQYQLRDMVRADPGLIGQRRTVSLLAGSDVDMFRKGYLEIDPASKQAGKLNERQLGWLSTLAADKALRSEFNSRFFTAADSREPELVGVWGGVIGSFYTLIICLLIAFPVGVAAAVYLEEFAPKNRFTEIIEVNINNLAAVPSIVYGLLGLAVFLNTFGMPRSAPLVGGAVLSLMSLPIIIIAGRAALKAVPPSIREAALGLGASKSQAVFHHVLPLAMPGILTGTILSMAHALGETAPLLMIGMVAFIVDIPASPTQASTVLPVQIFMWADSPERGFVEKTSAAILVLLLFLLAMNAIAIFLRKKFERKW